MVGVGKDLIPIQPALVAGFFMGGRIESMRFSLRLTGRASEAIVRYQNAVRLQPNLLPACGGLAGTLAAVNRLAEAIAAAEKAVAVAHSIGLDSEATHIQDWLMRYRAELDRVAKP